MTDSADAPSLAGADASGPDSAGAHLRAAREAAGLAIDAVAQQLKLAPRQVQALEDDDYAKLPGRTFVRGFVRNYARYLGLDPDEVVARLPRAEPLLDRPAITPAGRAMGHLPANAPGQRSIARWAIPLLLVAIVGAAGVYEMRRPQGEGRRLTERSELASPVLPADVGLAPGSATTTANLANPLATEPAAPLAGDAPYVAAAAPGAADDAARPTPAPADGLLVLSFKGPSWVQVKDRNGVVLLAQNGQPGMTQAVSGPLPLDVVVGNALNVSAAFQGQTVDLAPHVHANVARLSLQ